ncbi:hypothetical protein GuL6_188 [Buttiauxella phage vB_ButM_GuL6]|nr:hypothetical protein GuL6_188 [Buttiauxella phage vB_ButM_GuL6]
MKNKIYAYLTEHTIVRVILVDGPIATVETSDNPMSLPLKTSVGTFSDIINEMRKHSIVYLYKAEVYPYPSVYGPADENNIMVRWGYVE